MRFALDSNILVLAVTSPLGPALRLVDLVLESHTLVLSSFILDEVERVLPYPRIQSRYRITADEAIRFTRNLSEAAHLVEPTLLKPVSNIFHGCRKVEATFGQTEARMKL